MKLVSFVLHCIQPRWQIPTSNVPLSNAPNRCLKTVYVTGIKLLIYCSIIGFIQIDGLKYEGCHSWLTCIHLPCITGQNSRSIIRSIIHHQCLDTNCVVIVIYLVICWCVNWTSVNLLCIWLIIFYFYYVRMSKVWSVGKRLYLYLLFKQLVFIHHIYIVV